MHGIMCQMPVLVHSIMKTQSAYGTYSVTCQKHITHYKTGPDKQDSKHLH